MKHNVFEEKNSNMYRKGTTGRSKIEITSPEKGDTTYTKQTLVQNMLEHFLSH